MKGVKAKRTRGFYEATKDMCSVMEVNWSSVDKLDVDLHHEEEDGAVEGRGPDNWIKSTKEYSEG